MNKAHSLDNKNKMIVGWREWITLPQLGIDRIKAKIDTGARTSALHAFDVEPYQKYNGQYVRFKIHPIQKDETILIECNAKVFDQRYVTDSGGHKELRFIIKTSIVLGEMNWLIEITLTNRDTMGFRMLLGRTAMKQRLIVNPSKSFLINKR